MRISTLFLLPAEVMVTDYQTPISYSSLVVIMALSGLVFKIWAWDRQTTDITRQTDSMIHMIPLLEVSHLLLEMGHIMSELK